MKKSEFTYVGVGYNKTLLEPLGLEIKVFFYEQHASQDGDQMKPGQEVSVKTFGSNDNATVVNATISRDVMARWMPFGSNRLTAPTLHVGERVRIYKESDTGRYWWTEMGLDEGLRRLETVIWGISANPAEGVNGRAPENMYWIEFSSHSQKIALKTTANNGEKTAYEFYFDLKNGKVVLNDTVGNEIILDSLAHLIRMTNASNTMYELNKRDITGRCDNNITFTAGKNITLKAGTQFQADGGGSVFTETAGVTTLKTPMFQGSQ